MQKKKAGKPAFFMLQYSTTQVELARVEMAS